MISYEYEKEYLYMRSMEGYATDEEDTVSEADIIETLRQRKNDESYKTKVKKALIVSVKNRKPFMVRKILESLYGYYIKEEEVILICRCLFLDKGISLDKKVDKVIYDWQIL